MKTLIPVILLLAVLSGCVSNPPEPTRRNDRISSYDRLRL